MYWLVCFLCLMGCDKTNINNNPVSFVQGYFKTEEFKKNVVDKNYESALSAAIKAKEQLSSNLAVDNNLGVAFELSGKPSDAEKTLKSAMKNQTEKNDMIFLLNYNLGVHYGQMNQIDQALAHYQAALDIKPDSKETKHNIELLIQQQQNQQNQQQQQQQQDQNKDSQGQQGESKNDKKDDKKDGDDKDDQKNDKKQGGQDRKSNPKYKPRPFEGDQLSEGDVKKILGELSQQDKKIRQQYDQKNSKDNKEMKNEKDW